MNNTATNSTPCPTVRKQIGKTTYIVRVHFSQTAKETMEDKIKRLLRGKSAKCDFFLDLMKKSLTFRLWQNCQEHTGELRRTAGPI